MASISVSRSVLVRSSQLGEAQVELGSLLLGERLVGGVADEGVAEAEGVAEEAACPVGAHELAADHVRQAGVQLVASRLVEQLVDRGPPEDAPDDGCPLHDRPVAGCQPVQPRGDEGGDGRGHGNAGQVAGHDPAAALLAQHAVVDEHRDQLLDEERVALGGVADAPSQADVQPGLADELRDQLLRLDLAERLEQDGRGVELAAAPGRPGVEELRPTHGDDEDRRLPDPVGGVLDEVEERRAPPSGDRR